MNCRIPLKSDQIKIQGTGQSLKVALQYDVSIDIPIFRQGFYSKHYVHNVPVPPASLNAPRTCRQETR